jgi:spermidine/putrescine transport system substrate-binding protein
MNRNFLTPLDRRELLKRGLVVASIGAVPSFLAACGGDDDDGGEAAAPTATQAQETPTVPPASGTIDYLSWEGYDIPDATKAWRDEHGVEFESTYIGNHDDIQARIAAGGGSYDLITYYQGYKPLYQELGILSPIDISKVPNIDNEFPYFKSDVGNFWIDPDGTWTGVPWTFGSIGITWDDEALPGGLSSWYDLLDPKLENKIGLPDDPVGSFTLAAHTLGYDPAMVTQDQKTEIVDLLTQIVSHARSVAPSFGDMTTQLVNGDIVACWQGWAAMNSFAADAGKDTVMTTVPEEGSFSFCDLYAIPTTADNVDTVYSYLNNVLEPEVNAAAAEFLVGGVTVEGAVEFLDEGIRSLYPYEDLDGLLERAPFYNNPPVESDEYVTYGEWIDTWQEVKAST